MEKEKLTPKTYNLTDAEIEFINANSGIREISQSAFMRQLIDKAMAEEVKTIIDPEVSIPAKVEPSKEVTA